MSNNTIGSTKHTEQAILNRTFDAEFDIVAVEALGYDGANLQRIKTNSAGKLQVDTVTGFEIPPYDEIDLTYVAAGDGDGAGEVETAIYSLDGTPHTTLTLTYNASNEISNVTKT